jgi:hypothetical protein
MIHRITIEGFKKSFWSLLIIITSARIYDGRSDEKQVASTLYLERLNLHNELAVLNGNHSRNAQPILAFLGLPLNEDEIATMLWEIKNHKGADFRLVKLVRILAFTDAYDDLILPVLRDVEYWSTVGGENADGMNSENHMILWMSSSWLLQEREGWPMDDRLQQRLLHFLNLKIQYGYYEFLSMTYFPFTLSALMNLADFATDVEIRHLAENAARRLLGDNLQFLTNKGVYFPVAGRGYPDDYFEPYVGDHDRIFNLLTGFGETHETASSASCFLSTSKLDFSDIAAGWQPSLDTTYSYGHPLQASFEINQDLDFYDRVVFQMSQGAYFHPDVAQDTLKFIKRYELVGFFLKDVPLVMLANMHGVNLERLIPTALRPMAAKTLAVASRSVSQSSVISGASIKLFRYGGSMLSSIQGFWPGRVGYQQFPWIAVADDIAVWTQSGRVGPESDWDDRSHQIANTHLPYVAQDSNVAMIVYKPFLEVALAGLFELALDRSVALYWPVHRFEETHSVGRWVLGRRGEAYVAVYRPCTDTEQGWFSCAGNGGRQLWAAVVGNMARHGSLDDFMQVIKSATIQEEMAWNWRRTKREYHTSVTVDGRHLEHTW